MSFVLRQVASYDTSITARSGFNYKGDMYLVQYNGTGLYKVGVDGTITFVRALPYQHKGVSGVVVLSDNLYYLTMDKGSSGKWYYSRLVRVNLQTGDYDISSGYKTETNTDWVTLYKINDELIGFNCYTSRYAQNYAQYYAQIRYIKDFTVYDDIFYKGTITPGSKWEYGAPPGYYEDGKIYIYAGLEFYIYDVASKSSTTVSVSYDLASIFTIFRDGFLWLAYGKNFDQDTWVYTGYGCDGTKLITDTSLVRDENFYQIAWDFNGVYDTYAYASGTKLFILQVTDANSIYSIKSYNGSQVLGSIKNYYNITKITCNVVDNTCTVTINGASSTSFKIPIIEGRTFQGLSLSALSSTAYIPADGSEVSLTGTYGTTFYLSYSKVDRPITDGFDVNLYRNSASPDRVDKSEYLQSVTTLNGVLRDETSITDLTVTIQYDSIPNFNYAYIPSFSRYYYITDIRSIRYNLWEIDLNVDVLMTYKEGLYKCVGFIDRNEYDYNAMVVDDMLPLEQGQEVTTTFIDNDVFVDQGQYVLTGLLVSLRSSGNSSSDSSDSGSSGTGGSTDTGDSGEGGDENPDDTHQDPVESGGGEESGGG